MRKAEGAVRLQTGKNGPIIAARIDRRSNCNGTARIYDSEPLRDWFVRNFKLMEIVEV